MNIESITRKQKVKEAVEFTIAYMKFVCSLSIFCLISVFLFDEEKKSINHSLLCISSSIVTIHLFKRGIVGYKLAICLSFTTDAILLDLSCNRFYNFRNLFGIVGHQLFIQSCVFNYYTQPLGYITIILRTVVWQYLMNAEYLKGHLPVEIPCVFICSVLFQIFFVWILEKKTNGEISTRIELEYQLSYLKGILQEISYGILVVDGNLKHKYKNRAYDDMFSGEDFVQIYKKSKNKGEVIQEFLNSDQVKVCVGKFYVNNIKVLCNASKGCFEKEKFAILTFNRILDIRSKDDQELSIASMLQELSHDLKTPLNAIVNNQREVIENKDLPKEMKHSLKKSYSNSCVLLCFIQDIIDYSKLNSDLLIVNPHFFEVKSLIKECSKYVKHAFLKNCKFTIQENVSKMIYFDQFKLRQILIGIFYACIAVVLRVRSL